MKKILLCLLLSGWTAGALADSAQKNEVGLVIGATLTPDVGLARGGEVKLDPSVSFGVEYDRLLLDRGIGLYGGVDFLASPFDVKASNPAAGISPEYAYLFLTPHVRVKLHPGGALEPWLLLGGGYANFAPKQPADSEVVVTGAGSTGALVFGAGIDTRPIVHLRLPLLPGLSVGGRLEARDFVSGQPKYGVPTSSSVQHNVNLGGGLLLRF